MSDTTLCGSLSQLQVLGKVCLPTIRQPFMILRNVSLHDPQLHTGHHIALRIGETKRPAGPNNAEANCGKGHASPA